MQHSNPGLFSRTSFKPSHIITNHLKSTCDRFLLLSILSFKFGKMNIHHPPIKMLMFPKYSFKLFCTLFVVNHQPNHSHRSVVVQGTHHPIILSSSWDPFTAAWIWALPTIGLMRRVGNAAARAKSRKVLCFKFEQHGNNWFFSFF